MRARLAIAKASVNVELREVVLRDKPEAFLTASDSGTVPCLVTNQGTIDESLDIMKWALEIRDPDGWLDMPQAGWDLIEKADGPFKSALDRTKYATRYPDVDATQQRARAIGFLLELEDQLTGTLFDRPTIADFAILPFVRQFAFIDKVWFDKQPWPRVQAWLETFLASDAFHAIMSKYPQWSDGDAPTPFPT